MHVRRSPLTARAAVAVGGAAGSLARVAADAALPRPLGLPVATFVVNVSGALLLGLLLARTDDPVLRAGLGTGLLGAWTTFSALVVETEQLTAANPWFAVVYVAGSVLAGLVAARLGRVVGT